MLWTSRVQRAAGGVAVVMTLAAVATLGLMAAESDPAAGELAVDVPPNPVAAATAATPAEMKPYAEPLVHTDVVIDMVPISGGTFVIGSPEGEADRNPDEGPTRTIEIEPFWMSRCEITWDAYDVWGERLDMLRRDAIGLPSSARDPLVDAVTKPTEPYTDMSFSMGKGNQPAISMTDHAARTFCKWLSAKTGRYYRLPTEAEWEYACRAGTTTAYSFGDDPSQLDDFAWYKENSDGHYHDVGQKKPNPWGLYDMHGNVAEWTLDQYSPDVYSKLTGAAAKNPLQPPLKEYPRVVRGGGWDDSPNMLRSAVREGSDLEWKQQDPQSPQSIWYLTDAQGLGFRVVRPFREPTAQEKAEKWDKNLPIQKDPEEYDR
ncbi:MAG: formylglycine-generating enzyme family protein [Planctomycetaceae bacterium]